MTGKPPNIEPKTGGQKSVALLIESSNAYARGLLSGIVRYVNQNSNWSIYFTEQERGATPPAWLQSWGGDGLIARIETDVIADAVARLTIPVVDVSAARLVPEIPWVETDDQLIAKLAAEHFLERGFKHLAFCGDPDFNWSTWREEAFVNLIREAGLKCHVFHSKSARNHGYSITRERSRLSSWIAELPNRVGIFACYDNMAQRILDICRETNVSVPESLAVLGVDNDELLCNLCTPPLSSVMPSSHKAGQEAARLLDMLMQGEEVTHTNLIAPVGVVTRQSTDVLAVDDEDIAKAVRFIRDYACDGIMVQDVLKEVPLSRRVLESRFKEVIGRTPHQEITRRRIEKICDLLQDPELTLGKIAHLTGFQNEGYMSVAFRREMGMPPGQYRRSRQ